jgi:hypothetical protein
MASGPCSNMKAHFGEKELRMVLDDGQPGMVIGTIQTYRHDCVGVNYHRILSLAIEQGKPAYDGHGNVKDVELSKLLVTTEFDLPPFDPWYVEGVKCMYGLL